MSDATVLGTPLLDAATQAFEALGYFFVEALDATSRAPDGPSAAVDFSGPQRGTVLVTLSTEVLGALAANMLGCDDPPERSLQLDALGELANVICGSVLPSLGGPRAVFCMTAPRAGSSRDALAAPQGTVVAHAALDVDGTRADVLWFVT